MCGPISNVRPPSDSPLIRPHLIIDRVNLIVGSFQLMPDGLFSFQFASRARVSRECHWEAGRAVFTAYASFWCSWQTRAVAGALGGPRSGFLTPRRGMSANERFATTKAVGGLVHLTDKESPPDAAIGLKRGPPLAQQPDGVMNTLTTSFVKRLRDRG